MSEVKEVFQRLLEDAPPMARSAEDFVGTARGSRSRRRGLLVSGAAALAVVAVAATASAMLARQPSGAGPLDVGGQTGQTGQATATATAGVPNTGPVTLPAVALLFVPTWVPTGWAEHGRMAGFGENAMGPARSWATAPADVEHGELKGPRFELRSRKDPGHGLSGDETVDINGRPGVVIEDMGRVKAIDWRAAGDDNTLLTLQQWNNALTKQEMLRIARSVQPDAALFTQPFRLGPIPTGYAPSGVEFVGRSAQSWHVTLTLAGPAAPEPTSALAAKLRPGGPIPTIRVSLGTETLAPEGGEAITVGGRPGRYVVAKVANGTVDLPYVVVDLGGGLLVTTSSFDAPRDQLIQAALAVTPDPAADLSWIGRAG